MKRTTSFLWAALSMTAALVMTACSSDNDMTETPAVPQPSVKTIPYTVTVTDGTTRATVDSDNRTLRFATGDKLYITGTNIKGTLNIQSGMGETSGATFSGDLTYTGSGDPAADLSLTATLVSAQQTVGTQISVNDAGAVTVNYPTTAYCSSVNDAVQQYSRLTGTSTYGDKAFTLTQQTAFLNFVITFEDNTNADTQLSAVFRNNSSAVCTANVTTTIESEKVVAKFVLPVASGTTLTSATVKMGDKEALTITDATLDGKVYNVRKTVSGSSSNAPVAVDMGLPSGTKWANMNLGANSPEDIGDYYAWGETEPYFSSQNPLTWKTGKEAGYNWASYTKFGTHDNSEHPESGFNKYNTTDGKYVLEAADDAATANWGNDWRMPTKEEVNELLAAYPINSASGSQRRAWLENYNGTGVNGLAFYDASDNILLFLPASGVFSGTTLLENNALCSYWSSTLLHGGVNSEYASALVHDSTNNHSMNSFFRFVGQSIRPVK